MRTTLRSNDGKVKLVVIKNEFDEWVVKWYEKVDDVNGRFKYSEDKTGYESTKEDALGTAKASLAHYEKHANIEITGIKCPICEALCLDETFCCKDCGADVRS